jgi:tRNA threonylcarbamoyladenosine biosynthesis protein TsaE
MTIQFTITEINELKKTASDLLEAFSTSRIFLFQAEMGAGKTAFATGFAKALGVHGDDHVSSPTFTLIHSYTSGRIPLHHADLYRLTSLAEVADLGIRELLDMGAVGLVEWGDVASEVLGDGLSVTLEADDEDDDVAPNITGHSAF